jgi:precorrin-2 dehydrogenase/sirohydrochlorin ferrochelatase
MVRAQALDPARGCYPLPKYLTKILGSCQWQRPGRQIWPRPLWHSACISLTGLVHFNIIVKYQGRGRNLLPGKGRTSLAVKTYPIFAVIEDKPCLVVGGGHVGQRKVHDLLAAGARVTVVSRTLTPELAAMASRGEIRYLPEDFSETQVEGMALVMAATDDPEVNARVSAAAQARAIWVNVADEPEHCTFIVPAQVRRGDLTLAISTGGGSPALARQLREELQLQFGPEYGPYLNLLQRVRARLLAERRAHPDNGPLFHHLVRSPLREAVARGDRAWVAKVLHEVLGSVLSTPVLGELVSQAFEETEG